MFLSLGPTEIAARTVEFGGVWLTCEGVFWPAIVGTSGFGLAC